MRIGLESGSEADAECHEQEEKLQDKQWQQGWNGDPVKAAEIEGSCGGKAPSPDRYVDLTYYDGALKRLNR